MMPCHDAIEVAETEQGYVKFFPCLELRFCNRGCLGSCGWE